MKVKIDYYASDEPIYELITSDAYYGEEVELDNETYKIYKNIIEMYNSVQEKLKELYNGDVKS